MYEMTALPRPIYRWLIWSRPPAGRTAAGGVTAPSLIGRLLAVILLGTSASVTLADVLEPRAAPRPAAPATAIPSDAIAREADMLAQRIIRDGGVVGLGVAIVDHGEVKLARGYGSTVFGSAQKVNADTPFRLASLSKSFAGALTSLLVSEGVLSWDQRIRQSLPAFQLKDFATADRLTIQDILNHRVGLPYNTFDRRLEANEPYGLLVSDLATVSPACTDSSCYGYQNITFSLIGDIVFSATGDFYTHQVERRLFHPLGMETATYGKDPLVSATNWARPHVRRGGGWAAVDPKETYYRIPPAAGVNASADDMAQWLLAQLGHAPDVLSLEVLADQQRPRVVTAHELRSRGWRGARVVSAHYANGWRVFTYGGQRVLFHAGAVQGYRAMMAIVPGRDFGVMAMWNCESGVPGGLVPTLLDRALGLPAEDWLDLDIHAARRSAATPKP